MKLILGLIFLIPAQLLGQAGTSVKMVSTFIKAEFTGGDCNYLNNHLHLPIVNGKKEFNATDDGAFLVVNQQPLTCDVSIQLNSPSPPLPGQTAVTHDDFGWNAGLYAGSDSQKFYKSLTLPVQRDSAGGYLKIFETRDKQVRVSCTDKQRNRREFRCNFFIETSS